MGLPPGLSPHTSHRPADGLPRKHASGGGGRAAFAFRSPFPCRTEYLRRNSAPFGRWEEAAVDEHSHSCRRTPRCRASLSSGTGSSAPRRRRARSGPRGPGSTPCTSCPSLKRGAVVFPRRHCCPSSATPPTPNSPRRGRRALVSQSGHSPHPAPPARTSESTSSALSGGHKAKNNYSERLPLSAGVKPDRSLRFLLQNAAFRPGLCGLGHPGSQGCR